MGGAENPEKAYAENEARGSDINVGPAPDMASELKMTTRNEMVERLKTKLDEWNTDLAQWEAKARTTKTDLRIEYEMRLEDLRKQREEATERLAQLQGSASEAWQDLAAGAEDAWSRMQDAFEKARAHFQK